MVVLITTCAGRGHEHLASLLGQIDESGWTDATIVVSDGPAEIATRARIDATATREGQMRTYWRALALGLEVTRRQGGDRLLILEDDVEPCRNALPYAARIALPLLLDFVTWFDGHAVAVGSAPGIHARSTKRFICLQAVTWPVETVTRLLAAPASRGWNEPHRGDLLIRRILRAGQYGVHVPNLFEHRGARSLCDARQTLDGIRVARNFPGASFDALTLAALGDA